MNTRIARAITAAFAGSLFFLASTAYADAPLKSALALSIEQAAQVAKIEEQARSAIRPVRSELHREERALRRAKLANDSQAISRQEALIEPLRRKFAAIHESETRQIRALLTPEQNTKYDAYLRTRDQMAGSSRDVKEYQGQDAAVKE
jgi:hypothetical protein